MKILSINNFTTKLHSKLLSDLYIGVYSKGTKKFGSKVINRQYFHRKTGLEGFDFTYVNVQQTPNPAAQFPSMEPPFDEHSEAVKHGLEEKHFF